MGFRKLLVAAIVACLGVFAHAATASAGDFVVGVDEDALQWGNPELTTSVAEALGLQAIRISLPWTPGQTQLAPVDAAQLDRAVVASWGLRVVVTVSGRAEDAPTTEEARNEFCGYVADVVRTHATLNDVVIWSNPNDGGFWQPQFNTDGSSAAPADYEALLATCWDALHAVRPGVNVVAASVSNTTTDPNTFVLGSHSAADWYVKLGAAYRASGRTAPIFDTLGHTPHPENSAERPWTRHELSGSIGLGDYGKLMEILRQAFGNTAQPLPGRGVVRIWYLAQGFQTTIDPSKSALYTGIETDPWPLPAWSDAESNDTGQGPAPDQATQLADSIRTAYCQPGVGAYFNFLLADQPDLAGWQSGVLWADWTPKPSYAALREVVREVESGSVDCAAVATEAVPPRLTIQAPSSSPFTVDDLRVSAISSFSATIDWRTSAPATTQVAFGLPESGPTLWAPVETEEDAQKAKLSGLSYATTYRVWLTSVADDGGRTSAIFDLTTPGAPTTSSSTVDRDAATLLVDGQPFFPLMVWSQCPSGYSSSLAVGINLFAENPCGGLQTQLTALWGRALSAGVTRERSAPLDSGLVGFFYPDEPDGLGISGAALPPPPAGVAGPSFLTLTNHFYSGAAPLPAGRGMYPGLIARADVVGFDLYPLQECCRADRLGDVYLAQQELARLSTGKPTFQWIETKSWRCPAGQTAVTPETVRAESWLAIAGGAKGLGFFPASWTPDIGAAIARVSRDVAKLGPALSAPASPDASDNANVWVGSRSYDGATYVIAVNAGFEPVQATLKAPEVGTSTLSVLDENRSVLALDGTFSDSFEPLGVHVYVVQPR